MDSIIYEYMKNTRNIVKKILENKYYIVFRPNPNNNNGNIYFIYVQKESRGIYRGYIIFDIKNNIIAPYSHDPDWNTYIAGEERGIPNNIEDANYTIEPKDKIVSIHKAKIRSGLQNITKNQLNPVDGLLSLLIDIIRFNIDYDDIIDEQKILSKQVDRNIEQEEEQKEEEQKEENEEERNEENEETPEDRYENENENMEDNNSPSITAWNMNSRTDNMSPEIESNIRNLNLELDNILEKIRNNQKPKIEYVLSKLQKYETLKYNNTLPILKNRLKEIENEYLLFPMKLRVYVDGLRHLYEEILYRNYRKLSIKPTLYPSRENPNFQEELEKKEEIQILKQNFDRENIIEKMKNSCNNITFEYQNHQKFISVMLENYQSLLVYHGTGVGKTCSSIMSAETYLETHPDSKVYVILPKSVRSSFLKQIFNTDDHINKKPQCTREKYPMIANLIGETNINILEKGVSKIINNRYELRGYQEFANIYKRKKEQFKIKYEGDEEKIALKFHDWIHSKFNNSFIIVDEAHKLRAGNNEEKEIYEVLEHIFRITENCKFLAMSATPIYNQPDEIIELLNLLRLNEKRSTISDIRLFEDNEYLKRKTTGYISYMRSENPIYFAQQVYPSRFSPNDEMKIKPINNYEGIPIPDELQFNTFELIDTPLSPEHSEVLMETLPNSKYKNVEELDEDLVYDIMDEALSPNITGDLLQMSNMVAPKIKDANDETKLPTLFSKKIFDEHFTKTIRSKRRVEFMKISEHKQVQLSYKDNQVSKGLFQMHNLEKYVKCIQTGEEGLIFIYSRYRFSGVIPIALALEEAGITKYGGIPLLSNPVNRRKLDYRGFYEDEFNEEEHGKFVQAKYILLSGNNQKFPLGKFNNQEIRKSNLSSNIRGEFIKVILGTESIAEGVDFYNIRSLHILEPWYHFNLLKQVIGRGVRFCRHSELPIEKRNVMIHLYGTRYTIPDDEEYPDDIDPKFNVNNETIDMFLFRYGQMKAKEIGFITRLLKKNSADCNLNKEVNVLMNLGDIKKSKLMNGTTINIPIGDQPYSYYCDFMQECDYECTSKIPTKVDKKTFNQSTFYYEIESYIQYITDLMRNNDILDVRKIRDKNGEELNPTILTEVLLRMNGNDNYIIVRDNTGFNGDPIYGKLEILNKYYAVFRPLKMNSMYLSLHHRSVNPIIKSRFATSFYRMNEYVETEEEKDRKFNKNMLILEKEINEELFTWTDAEQFNKSRNPMNNDEFNEHNVDIFRRIANLLGEFIFTRPNQQKILMKITREIIIELFLFGRDNGKKFIEEYTRRIIKSSKPKNFPLFEDMSKYLFMRKKSKKIQGYIWTTRTGSDVSYLVYIYDKNTDSFSPNPTYKSELERTIINTFGKLPTMSKILGSRYISKKGKSGYKFKLIDFTISGRSATGIDCTTTGQKSNKESITRRMTYISQKMRELEGVNLDPTIILKNESGRANYSNIDIEKIRNGETRFPKFLMCFFLEIILRYMQRKDNNMTHYIHYPFTIIFNKNVPFEEYSKIKIDI
jgi:hypothetical protein